MLNINNKLETIKIGATDCTFLRAQDFKELCKKWLWENKVYHIVTLNPEMVLLAENDKKFCEALNNAELRVPDGAGIIWARWYLRSQEWFLWSSLIAFLRQPVDRITGVDSIMYLANICKKQKKGMHLIGGSDKTVGLCVDYLQHKFPGLHVTKSLDHKFQENGPDFIFDDIEKFRPGVVLVAYGAPKQTIWIENNKHKINGGPLVIGVGGAFDIISESLPRAPLWIRKNNIEWLWRLYLEPGRLPRIWRAVIKFPILINLYKKKKNIVK